jgi:hypothetical protein
MQSSTCEDNSMQTVVHYGLCSLAYSGYILHGLHQLADKGLIRLKISRAVPADLRAAAASHPHMQMMPVFDVIDGRAKIRFCVDNHDKADFVHPELINDVDYYFKLNHNPGLLDGSDLTPTQRQKIIAFKTPISPVRPPRWQHRPSLRTSGGMAWGRRDIIRRIRHLQRLVGYEDLVARRSMAKTVDVFFVNRIYQEPHHKPLNNFRYEVGSRLAAHPDINARVGFIGPGVTGRFLRYAADESTPGEHLDQLASSRVGIYVWGTHRCLSFKLCELLALGLPVAGQTIPQDRENLDGLPHLAEQFAYDDPQELVDAAARALGDTEWLHDRSLSNTSVFDKTLAPMPSAKRVIDHILSANA